MTLPSDLLSQLQQQALTLGFAQCGVAGVDLSSAEAGLLAWLEAGFHGEMHYMQSHGLKRARPAELVPGTLSVITVRMNYLPLKVHTHLTDDWRTVEWKGLRNTQQAQISLYARGRDYHKVMRQRLQKLADWLAKEVEGLGYRVFTDSAPVLEAELASRSGLGWRGKHTLILNRDAGSMFFLGEIYINAALPPTPPQSAHCGQCQACLSVCPTQAIVAPYLLDARRCIAYLTIEHPGPIPVELRPLIGNRIYGCDDCQLICPWNKFAQHTPLADFAPRPILTSQTLLDLWRWSEVDFLNHTQGSALRRIGFERWQRNLAVGLGNALASKLNPQAQQAIIQALEAQLPLASPLVQEHIAWALHSFIGDENTPR